MRKYHNYMINIAFFRKQERKQAILKRHSHTRRRAYRTLFKFLSFPQSISSKFNYFFWILAT